jgi:hypothetical protein
MQRPSTGWRMRIKGVPVRFRIVLLCLTWILSLGSVVISLFTLPTILAGSVSVLALLVPWIVSRIVFVHHVLWVMPPLSEQSERNRLGTMWVKEEFQGKQHLGLGLLYEDFEHAKDAYNVLRSWSIAQ